MSLTADGKENTSELPSYKTDGKNYPVKGNPDYDSLTGKQVSASKAEFVLKRAGKEIGTTDRTISKDGKTLTVKLKFQTASGQSVEGTLVFDKQ